MNRKNQIILALMFVFIFTNILRADWTTYRGDQLRSGYYGGASVLAIPVPYSTVVISNPGATLSQPVKSGNYIYTGTSNGTLVKVDITSGGTISGTFQTGGPIVATPLIYNNELYVGSLDGYFYAINTTDMTLNWKVKASSGISASAVYFTDTSGKDDIIFVDNNGKIYSLQLKTDGTINNTVNLNLNDYISASPAFGNSLVLISSSGVAYTVNNACTASSVILLTSSVSSNPLLTNNSNFIASGLSGDVWNYNVNGTQNSHENMSGPVFAPAAYDSGADLMRITSQNAGLQTGKINITNGMLTSMATAVNIPQVSYSGAVLTGNSVINPSYNGDIRVFDRSVKSLAGKVNIGANITSDISVDDKLVVAGNDGVLHLYTLMNATISPTYSISPTFSMTPTITPTPTISYTWTISATITPTLSITITPTNTATPDHYAYAVNCGGAEYNSTYSGYWSADQPYTPGSWGYIGSNTYQSFNSVFLQGTDEQQADSLIYKNCRNWEGAGGVYI